MRRLLNRLRSEESGIALIMALGTIVVLSILVVSVIDYSATNSRESSLSSYRQRAYTLAEAGLNDALSVLTVTQTPLYSGLFPSRTGELRRRLRHLERHARARRRRRPRAPATSRAGSSRSVGSMRNPAGGSKIQTRTLTIRVPLDPVYQQPLVNDAYDYVFVYGTGAVGGCDFSASNSSGFTSALYVLGKSLPVEQRDGDGGNARLGDRDG